MEAAISPDVQILFIISIYSWDLYHYVEDFECLAALWLLLV